MSESTPPVATPDSPSRSPIAASDPVERHGWVVNARRSISALTLSDETPLAKIAVRGPVRGTPCQALGVGFGRAAHTKIGKTAALTVGSGPGEWLVFGEPDARPQLLEAVRTAVGGGTDFVSVIDLTHGRAVMRLSGSRSGAVLEKICGIDFADLSTPNGAALRTSVATVVTDIVRDDAEQTPSYLLHCERSTGQFLFDAITDAGTELGIDTTTFAGLAPRQ